MNNVIIYHAIYYHYHTRMITHDMLINNCRPTGYVAREVHANIAGGAHLI